jgi:hypothetical protein
MGGGPSKQEQSETINWDNIDTDKFSSSMSNFNGLSKDAKTLIASLNIPIITESEISDVNLNNILNKINNKLDKNDQYKFNKLLENVSYDSENLSDTSPFISSDMYNYLVNSNMSESDKVKQTGGSKKSKSKSKSKSKTKSKTNSKTKSKTKSKKGGAELVDNSSDTTSTSSASSLSYILDSSEDEQNNKDKIKHHKKDEKIHSKFENKKNEDDDSDDDNNDKSDDDDKETVSNSELSGGELSYISSSAHTGGEFSDSSKSSSSSSAQETVTNENTNISMSVKTDDINMVSDY